MTYKVVAFDMDGTLLTQQRTILPETVAAISALKARDITILLVTGRHHSAVYPYSDQLQLETPAICCNGSYCYDFQTQSLSCANTLTVEQSLAVVDLLRQYDISAMLYLEDAMLYEHNEEYIQDILNWVDTLPKRVKPILKQVTDFKNNIAHSNYLLKLMTYSQNIPALTQFAEAVKAQINLSCEWSWSNRVDVAQQGNSKGNGLAAWAKDNHVAMQDIVAFGDNDNDISMLSSVGLGVAMGNSDDAVKQHAKRVIGDYNTPVIAQALQEIFSL